LEFICNVMNDPKEPALQPNPGANSGSPARSGLTVTTPGYHLVRLVTEWQESGRNLQKMVAANEPLRKAFVETWETRWLPTKTGGAKIAFFPRPQPCVLRLFDERTSGTALTETERKESLEAVARAIALLLFYVLTLGPWEKLGGPCPRCGKYFIKKRPNHKIYCSRRCGSNVSAKKATRERLDKDRIDKVLRAGAAIRRWDVLKNPPTIGWKQWVHKREPDITSKWLTRAVNDYEKYQLEPPKKEGCHAKR
jgi:hypothetical protein